MSINQKCNECDEYKNQGHNYCRMCGHHLTKGYVQSSRVAGAYKTNEKYCGCCGNLINKCFC